MTLGGGGEEVGLGWDGLVGAGQVERVELVGWALVVVAASSSVRYPGESVRFE
jgi:hypothetical protein